MNSSKLVRYRLSIAVLLIGFLFLAAACGGGSAPSPTPEPELTLDQLLTSVGEKLAAISTAKFQMVDEMETGAKFFGATLKTVEGEVKSPDGARMLVDVEVPAMGFVEIEILAVGDLAYMKFSRDAPWLPLPVEDVPFNFGGIGVALSELMPIMKDVVMGEEFVRDAQAIRIDGNVVSEEMGNLITSVDAGHPITLTLWFDEVEHTLRQFRLYGRLFDADGPETSRLVTMDIDVPVDIQLPDIPSEP